MHATRPMIEIDEALCDGCGLCIPSCHEGALEIRDGKARLVADHLCDGLGACLGKCPRGALRVVERTAEPFVDPHAHDLHAVNSIMEFIGIAKHDNLEVLIIGHGAEQHSFSDVDNLRHITDQIWNIEDYFKKSAYTGGIMNPGRTTIEGWLCGKPGYMWDVDWDGIIMKRYFESPPYDLDKFNAEVVTDQIYNLYIEALSF